MPDYSIAQPLSSFYGTHLNPVIQGYERLCDRVASSTLLEDRRDAVRALKSLSKVNF